VYTYAKGDKFEGDFANNIMNGIFTITWASDLVIERAEFEDG